MTLHKTSVGVVDTTVQSELHRHIAEIINDWDPTVFLVWIPPEQRNMDEEFPFGLLHIPENAPQYIIRKLRPEEVNETLLTWLWSNDLARTDVFGTLQAQEKAREALALKRRLEEKEARDDLATSILQGKHWYKHDGVVYK